MTCIIGLVEDGTVYMGGDSRLNFGGSIETHPRGKLLRKGELLIGTCGLSITRNLVEHVMVVPERPDDISDETYIVAHVIAVLHDLMHTHSLDFSESGAIIGYRQQVYRVSSDYSVTTNMHGVYCIGSGESLALGAMTALKDILPPTARILRALEIASEFNDGCAPPFYVESI